MVMKIIYHLNSNCIENIFRFTVSITSYDYTVTVFIPIEFRLTEITAGSFSATAVINVYNVALNWNANVIIML